MPGLWRRHARALGRGRGHPVLPVPEVPALGVLHLLGRAALRLQVPGPQKSGQDFEAVKHRLERWLASLDDKDPYRLLGVSPMATDVQIKARFRELAMEVHPDRGGSVERMREVNLAYEKILQHRARRTESVAQPVLVAAGS